MKSFLDFIIDYCQRHAHPSNAFLHILGVPAVFFGIYEVFLGRLLPAIFFILGGYLLQYIGHQCQGNEVGEITLIKHIWRKLKRSQSPLSLDVTISQSKKGEHQ